MYKITNYFNAAEVYTIKAKSLPAVKIWIEKHLDKSKNWLIQTIQ